jgi:hypothetical protein
VGLVRIEARRRASTEDLTDPGHGAIRCGIVRVMASWDHWSRCSSCCQNLLIRSVRRRKKPTKKPATRCRRLAYGPRQFHGPKVTPRLTCIFATFWDSSRPGDTSPGRLNRQPEAHPRRPVVESMSNSPGVGALRPIPQGSGRQSCTGCDGDSCYSQVISSKPRNASGIFEANRI